MATCEHEWIWTKQPELGRRVLTREIDLEFQECRRCGRARGEGETIADLRAQLTAARREAEEARGMALGEATEVCVEMSYGSKLHQGERYILTRAAEAIRALAPVAQEAEDSGGVVRPPSVSASGEPVFLLNLRSWLEHNTFRMGEHDLRVLRLTVAALASRAPAVKR